MLTVLMLAATAAAGPADGHRLIPYHKLCYAGCGCCMWDSCDCHNICPVPCSCSHDSHLLNVVRCSGAASLSPKSLPMNASHIYLDGGHLPRITKNAFLGRDRLRQLYLNASGVRAVDQSAFHRLSALGFVDLSRNAIREVRGDEFMVVPRLSQLILHGNAIERLAPGAFKGLPALEVLGLSGNRITELRGKEFDGLPMLRHLYLDGNHIRSVHADVFAQLPALASLTLHDNELKLLPEDIISRSLDTITLRGNPFRCDCGSSLNRWLPKHMDVVSDSATVVCAQEYNNLTALDASVSKVFSEIRPGEDGLIKVNFWTLQEEVDASLCGGVVGPEGTITIPVALIRHVGCGLAAALAAVVIIVIAVICHRRCKSAPTHYASSGTRRSDSAVGYIKVAPDPPSTAQSGDGRPQHEYAEPNTPNQGIKAHSTPASQSGHNEREMTTSFSCNNEDSGYAEITPIVNRKSPADKTTHQHAEPNKANKGRRRTPPSPKDQSSGDYAEPWTSLHSAVNSQYATPDKDIITGTCIETLLNNTDSPP